MAKILLLEKGRSLRFILALMSCFFLATTGWGQTTNYSPTVTVYNLAGERQDDFYPGETAVLKGTGWTQDQLVDVHLHEVPEYDHDHDYHGTVVDASGNWEIQYPIEERHLGVTFNVEVNGLQSGVNAYTVFTDSPKVGFVTVGAQTGTVCAGTVGFVTYTITVDRGPGSGSSGAFKADLTLTTTLPTGATASFSPSEVSFASSDASKTSTLTISTTAATPSGAAAFTVKAATSKNDFAEGSGTLTVGDGPSFTACPSDITTNTATGVCTKVVTYSATSATSITYKFTGATTGSGSGTGSGATFNKGITTVTLTTSNTCGSTTCVFKITVIDNEAPVVTCPIPAASYKVDAGECDATLNFVATGSDNCDADVALTYSVDGTAITFPYDFPTGTTTVTVTADDGDSNSLNATCTFDVVVIDNEAPVVTCPTPDASYNVDAGECNATLTFAATASDNCDTDVALTYSVDGSAITFPYDFPTGTTTVTLTADDGDSNSLNDTCTFDVVVIDNEAPLAPTLATVSGECSATVELPTTTDNCAGTITGTTTDPLTYTEQGTHTVTFTFDDGNGNQVTATQTVIVDDVTAPVAPTLATVSGECSATVSLPTTTDNCAGTITGTTTDPLTYTEQGTHTVTFTFDDGNGNQVTATQTVIVDDVTAPVAPTLATVSGECSATVTFPTTTDNCAGTITGTTTDPLTYTEQGTHTVTFTFDDGNGNQVTATQTVIVDDVTAPVAPTLATVSGECSATVTLPTTTDNCAGTITGTTTDPLTYTEQGTHTVTFTFDDGNGNQVTATQTVIVDDVTAPVAPTLATVSGECSATVSLPTTTDNCAGTITGTTTDPLTYTEQGTHTVTFTFDDGNGNQVTATQTVIVDDVTAPVAPTLATVSGECSATVELPTTTDNCVGTITGTTTDPLTYAEQGTHTVTFTFDDGNGNQVTATQTVIVDDVTAPVAPTLATVSGECSATVTLPTTTDNCAGTITGTTTDPLTYTEQGTHTVTFTFDDGNGNQVTATQTVIVDDVTAPVAPTLATVSGECSATVTFPTTTDNCAGTITGTTTDPLTYTEQGTHTVTFTFDDGNGNQVTATQTVIVDDVTAPVAPTLATVSGECSATVELPTTTDNCAGTITGTTTDPLTYAEQGTHTVTFTFDDGNGNQVTATQTVIVDDVTAPLAPTLATVSGECSATVTLPTTTDNCAGTITGTTTDPLTYTEQGTHTVTFTFDDGNGNQVTATQTVIVDDVTAPVAPTLATVSGECSATVTFPTTTDNCAGTITGTTTDPLTYTEQGTHTVTFTFDDGNGNQVTATQTVIVDDVTAPVAPTLATVSGECLATVELPTTTDNCVGTITGTTTDPLTYAEQGTHTVTFTFDDGNGNQVTATQTVIVDDVTAPLAPTLATVSGECSATVTLPTTTDNCAGTITGTTTDPLTYTEQGTHTVTFTFDDGNGNQVTATQTVIVDDVTAPVAPTLATVSGECSATVTFPTTTDNCAGTITGTTTDPLTYTEQGTHTVTFTFDDGNGNEVTATQTVIVDDVTAPVAPTLATVSGECSATVELPTTTDNCVGTITGTTTDPLTYTEQGTHTVTFTFDDGNGNQVTATQTVIVDDVTAPVAPTLATVSGECLATVELPTTTDNCVGTITGTTTDPLTYAEQGTHTVTFTFDDGNGNQVTATQTVIVDDVTAPLAPTLATVSGECSATVTLPTTTDNCAGTITGTTTDPLTYTEQGTHTVTFTFDDGNGNQVTATQTVIVDDVTAPVAPTLATVSGECSATVTFPTTTDNCAGTITGTTTDPLTYTEQGTHTVTFTFDDGNGNEVTATQTVIVDDVTAPVAPTLATVSGECSATVELPTTTDNCVGTITGTTTDPLTYAEQGTHTVTFTFDDGNGNQVTATQTVIVDDVTAPVAPTLATVSGECSATVELPTTTDNCAGTITGTTTDPLTYTEQGTHTVTFTFDDGNGNQVTATQTVIVDDVTPAAITCVENQTRSNDSGTCSYTVKGDEFNLVSAEDNCEVVSITNNINNKESLEGEVLSGTTNINWTVTDAGGNVSTCSFTVTVTNENPVINNITGPIDPVQVNTGGVKLAASYEDNNVVSAKWSLIANEGVVTEYTCTDCIGEGIIEGNFNPQPGVYTVELEVTDACGATAILKYEYIVIFDPTGGFVTGGGWITSPEGALTNDRTNPNYYITGRANFGFNAKYKTGRTNLTEVDGHTNFQFKAGDLHFSSFEHEDMSLVIAGKKATYTGYGTVNGSGVHRFRVIVIDGQANGGIGPDQFRIKIWGDGSNSDADVLYDNHRGIAESSDLATTLGGGSIVIHKPKSGGKMSETTDKLSSQSVDQPVVLDILGNIAVAPNPVKTDAAIRFSLIEDANVILRIFDFNGREVNRLFQGAVRANEVKEVSFQRNNLMSGIYIVKLTTDRGHSYDKQIIVE